MRKHHCVNLVVIPVLVAVLAGCAPQTKRFYDGPPRSASAVARIHDSPHVGVTGVEGKRFNWWGQHTVEVEPGSRVLSVALMGGTYSRRDYVLRFDAQAGHDYDLGADGDQERELWRPLLIDRATGQPVGYEKVGK